MGQTVVIRSAVPVGDVLLIDTDRSFTGQDGVAMSARAPGDAVPGMLSERLFGLGLGIDHVFVLQNTVTVRRPGGWDDDSVAAITAATEEFLRFYEPA